jgi:hypothetical protein
MCVQRRIDDLIKAGWGVVDSNFHPAAFHHWRREAFYCLKALLGPDHPYTEYFKNNVRKAEQNNVLAGGGILTAAKETMVSQCQPAHNQDNQFKFFPRASGEPCEYLRAGRRPNLCIYDELRTGVGNVMVEDGSNPEPESEKRKKGQ